MERPLEWQKESDGVSSSSKERGIKGAVDWVAASVSPQLVRITGFSPSNLSLAGLMSVTVGEFAAVMFVIYMTQSKAA